MRKSSALLLLGALVLGGVFDATPVFAIQEAPPSMATFLAAHNEIELRKNYDRFSDSMDVMKIARDYPGAIRNLLSAAPEKQLAGLATLSATGEIEVIPWIVPFLDSPRADTRIFAGMYLDKLVSAVSLKRRDASIPTRVALQPRRPEDPDLRPLAWVIYHMLQAPEDGNTQAYAADMIGYIGLPEFAPELRFLLESKHPAIVNAAGYGLELLAGQE